MASEVVAFHRSAGWYCVRIGFNFAGYKYLAFSPVVQQLHERDSAQTRSMSVVTVLRRRLIIKVWSRQHKRVASEQLDNRWLVVEPREPGRTKRTNRLLEFAWANAAVDLGILLFGDVAGGMVLHH